MAAKSDLLRFDDARAIYRLLGACRDLGGDPVLWFSRMLDGVCDLVGAIGAAGGEVRWRRPSRPMEIASAFTARFDAAAEASFRAYHRELRPEGDPIFQALQTISGSIVVRTRKDIVPDAIWYRSSAWADYRRPIGFDNQMTSVVEMSARGATVVAMHRATGERDFSPRERALMRFFHEELGRLIGGPLVSQLEPHPDDLSPRVRQTLACLLQGDGEKQVADRLGISQPTVHEYVTALYRHFGVNSRAQLLVHAARRSRQWALPEPGAGAKRGS